jgi:hypothetical protein
VTGVLAGVPYVVVVLGAAAVHTAGFLLWTGPTGSPGSAWRPWLLLIVGGASLCAAVALL